MHGQRSLTGVHQQQYDGDAHHISNVCIVTQEFRKERMVCYAYIHLAWQRQDRSSTEAGPRVESVEGVNVGEQRTIGERGAS